MEPVNLVQLQDTLKDELRAAARELFEIQLGQIAAEVPPRTELGDLAFPIAFELAKQIKQKTGEKRAPRSIAETIKPRLETIAQVKRVEVAGAGYLNVFFDRDELLARFSELVAESTDAGDRRMLMVGHLSMQP